MSTTRMLLAFGLLLPSAAQAGRIWFSLTGVPEGQPIAGTPPEYISPTQGINPEVNPASGTARLYVWGTLESPGRAYYGVCLDINVHVQTGGVSIVDSRFYNYDSTVFPPARRWDSIYQGVWTPGKLDDALLQAFLGGWGWSYYAPAFGDQQYDPATLSMLLGFVDLQMSADARAEIFFGVGQFGFSSQPPIFQMFFGWGDGPVTLWPTGQESALPDATIVPEPAAALRRGAAALLSCCSARARRTACPRSP